MRRWIGAASILCTALSLAFATSAFAERAQNPLLPADFKELDPFTQNSVVGKTREALERASHSVLQRIQVPISRNAEGKIENVAYFPLVNSEAQAISSDAEVMPSAGVIRSVEAYLCDRLEVALLESPKANAIQILDDIAKQTQPIPAIDVRGVGGDFDVLVRSRENMSSIIERITGLTNSAETGLGATDHVSEGKRLVFTVADVKDYERQIDRTTRQGGATIDFLAFSMQTGKFVEPPAHNYIIDDFIRGYYRYLAPLDEAERPQKQTVRGIRALLEFPFLEVQDPDQLKRELLVLTNNLQAGSAIDEKALEQVGKAIRNGRNSLGNNRILHGEPGSLEEAISKFSQALLARRFPHIPEYVAFTRLNDRNSTEKKELKGLPQDLLLRPSEFFKEHTTNGHVFHGTPSFDNAMAILRGGLYLSGGFYGQGGSAEGSGGYAGSSPAHAKQFPQGIVLDLKILDDPRINILDLKKLKNSPFMSFASTQAARTGRSLNDYLRAEHGIDIIVGGDLGAVLIQNMAAVNQGTASERIRSILEGALSSDNSYRNADPQSFYESLSLLHNALQMGIVTDIPLAKLREQVYQALTSEDKKTAGELGAKLLSNPLLREVYGRELADVVPYFSLAHLGNLEEEFETDKNSKQIPNALRISLKKRLLDLIRQNANSDSADELGPAIRLLGILGAPEDAAEITKITALLRNKKIEEYRRDHSNTIYLDRELLRTYFGDTEKIKEVLTQTNKEFLSPLLVDLATELARPHASRLHAVFLAASTDHPELIQSLLPAFYAQKNKVLERVLTRPWGLKRLTQSVLSTGSVRALVRQLPRQVLAEWAFPLVMKYPWAERTDEDRSLLRELYFENRNGLAGPTAQTSKLHRVFDVATTAFGEMDPVILDQIRKDIQSGNASLANLAVRIIMNQRSGNLINLKKWLPGFDKPNASIGSEAVSRYKVLHDHFRKNEIRRLDERIAEAAKLDPEQYAKQLPLFGLKNDIMELWRNPAEFGNLSYRVTMALTLHRVWPKEISDQMANELAAYLSPIRLGTATYARTSGGRKQTGPTPPQWYSNARNLLSSMQYVVNPTPKLLQMVENFATLHSTPEISNSGIQNTAKRTYEALSKASELAKLARDANFPTEATRAQEIRRIRKSQNRISDSTPESEYRMIQLERTESDGKTAFEKKCLDSLIQLGQ